MTTSTIVHGTTTAYRKGCHCEECRAAVLAYNRQWRERNADRKKANDLAWYERNRDRLSEEAKRKYAENSDEIKATALAWYHANKERAAETHRAWRLANLEHKRERSRANAIAWSRANPQRKKANGYKGRAARRNAEVRVVTERDWRRLCGRYHGRCAYCGAAEELTQDHVIPISRGGRHAIGNLLPACRSCNSSKRTRLLVEWVGRP